VPADRSRSQRELARSGLTRSPDRDLTPTELRVAQLAAAGSQNKEIAGALFISVKSVEANLWRVYAKLGVPVPYRARLPAAEDRENEFGGLLTVDRGSSMGISYEQ
jgi:DNA-binding NarL/FixJ family response regulator